MMRVVPHAPGTLDQRLVEEADRRGNSDGVATPAEVAQLAKTMEARPAAFDADAGARLQAARALGTGSTQSVALDPALRKLPEGLRRLALELDGLWGNADGKVTVSEIDRVARYYLAALPFFTKDAGVLLELAHHLKLDDGAALKSAPGVVALRAALAKVDRAQVEESTPFRALFDQAVAESDLPGAPEMLRDAAAHSPRWHRLSILEHTAVAAGAAPELAKAVGVDWKDAGAALLLHDVGKMLDRKVQDATGPHRFTFWGHEGTGADWLQQHQVSEEIVFLVRNHAILREKTADQLVELAGGDPTRLAHLLVMYVADQVAKGNTPDQLASFREESPKILECCRRAGVDGDALLQRAQALRAERFPSP